MNIYDTHMHTPFCNHARGVPEEYAKVAFKIGLKGVVFTDHCPLPQQYYHKGRMQLHELDDYVKMVNLAKKRWKNLVDIHLGLECDYIPELEVFLKELLSKHTFSFVLGSIHPKLPYYRKRYKTDTAVGLYKSYYENLARAAESCLFHSLSHPDLIKTAYPHLWDEQQAAPFFCKALDRISQTGVAVEINTSGYMKCGEPYPNFEMISEICKRNIPITLGSDAHDPHRVGEHFPVVLQSLNEYHNFLQIS